MRSLWPAFESASCTTAGMIAAALIAVVAIGLLVQTLRLQPPPRRH